MFDTQLNVNVSNEEVLKQTRVLKVLPSILDGGEFWDLGLGVRRAL